MKGWQQATLAEVIHPSGTIDPTKTPDVSFEYVDVSSVNNRTLQIVETNTIVGKDAPSRARRLVKAGDVIFATIRPTLKRIAVVPDELDGHICSTGYFVLRPKPSVSNRFLFYFLQTDAFIAQMEKLQTGASYPAVNDAQVKQQPFCYPSLPEQERIVAILDEAFEAIDKAIANTEKNLANVGELFERVVAADIFGSHDQLGWRTTTVSEVAAPQKGAIRTGPFGSQLLHSEFVDQGIAVLGIDNAVENEFAWQRRRYITPEKYAALIRYTVRPGDVLITIMGTCGRCAVVPDDIPVAINTKHLCCITLDTDKCLPQYLHAYFLNHPLAKAYLGKHAKGAIMAGLNMTLIQEMPLALPNTAKQHEISASVTSLRNECLAAEENYRLRLAKLAELKQAILSKAFSGQLPAPTELTEAAQ